MKKADIISNTLVFLAGLALLFFIIPVFVPTILDGDYGLLANTLPNIMAVTITVLSGAFLIYRISGRGTDSDPPLENKNAIFLLKGAIFLIALTLLMEFAGFLAAGPLLVGGFMLMMGERRLIPVAIAAIGAPVAVWLFFSELLGFPLP